MYNIFLYGGFPSSCFVNKCVIPTLYGVNVSNKSSIGRKPTSLPAYNCLKIIICFCVVSSKCVLLQIILCSCVTGTTFLREMANSFPELPGSDWNMKTNLVIKWWNNYWTRLSQNIVISQCVRLRQILIILDLLATGKSQYFAQPCATDC